MANGKGSQVQWKYQRPAAKIYRVGDTGSFFTTIQSAINQAVADGFVNNDSPAYIEIDPGTYTENLSLAPGIHLRGKGTERANIAEATTVNPEVVIIGNHVYANSNALTRSQNRVILQGINLSTLNGVAFTISGTGNVEVLCFEMIIQKQTGGDATSTFAFTNTNGGSRIRLSDCTIACDVAATDVCDMQRGTLELRGRSSGVFSLNGVTLASAFKLSNSAVVNNYAQQGTFGSFTAVYSITSTTAAANNFYASITNTLVGGFMVNYVAAGTARFRFCQIFLQDATSKVANGAAGNLNVTSLTFSNTITAPFAAIDSGINVNTTGRCVAQKNSSTAEFQVSRGVGYGTIQAAINAAAASPAAFRKSVLIPPGQYTENLTLASNVDLVADTNDTSSRFSSTVKINGDHTYVSTGGTVRCVNINFTSNNLSVNPLFSISGGVGGALEFVNCVFDKTFAGATSILRSTVSQFYTYLFDRCSFDFSSDAGSLFDMSGTTAGGGILTVRGQRGVPGGAAIGINQVAAGVPLRNLLVNSSAVNGMSYEFQYVAVSAFSSRLFLFNSASDAFGILHSDISAAYSTGETFKFENAASGSITNSTIQISGDGQQTGKVLIARDGGLQASGLFTFVSNPLPASTVEVDGTTITFGVDVVIGATKEDTADNLANFINGLGNVVEAVHTFGTDTILVQAINTGVAGNAITFLSSTGDVTASGGGTLSGGTNGLGGGFFYGSCSFGFNEYQSSLSVNALTSTLSPV